MNQDLILQQIGQLSQIARNKGKNEEEAAKDAFRFVKGLLTKSTEVSKKYSSLNKELIFHQMSSQAFSLYHTIDNQEEILETVTKSISEYAEMSKKLSEEFAV
ncbi:MULTISPECIES: hypothetical protein [Leptospira]|uniref:Uncharacterized protein n=2 Tax=Leptospira interrogans TaxID=173 RepID=A0A0E2D954_LEPIR|nr:MULTISPECIES: hypothetical protein [Leptospira]KAA1293034.1 hypothetical protein C4X99_03865 [Leptospira interrogans serovar Geyaweera]EKR56607.1 hypothetical protein LEP1GSC105_4253 [Leptospira interrogans str. UI 12758]EMN93042.1 hypothetical protein LEP1GSC110_0242 [Leptospira interrogans serovar Medanensis str. UT053]EMO96075.1 hypothetical protein LEP1GSC109_0178 [Leptospira interrogans str. UI 13372]MCL8311312.1 hypothetical protein [Leptospira interrogans]